MSEDVEDETKGQLMLYNRREIGKIAIITGVGSTLWGATKPNSSFGGVQIGAISYSFREMDGGSDARSVLQYCVDTNVSALEFMGPIVETYAGSPASPGRNQAPAAGAAAVGAGRGSRTELGPEQRAAQQRAADELKRWRLSVSMDKYKALRKLYNDAGVSIYAYRLAPTAAMSDEEYEYCFNVAEALGANQISLELPAADNDTYLKRLGEFAVKRHMVAAYHTHLQSTSTSWDRALELSRGNAIQLDCGHYFAATGESPISLILKHHDRIASMHLKDRKKVGTPGGDNLPWGQGSTPLKDILQTMKKNKYKFPAAIELEYAIPAGSDSVKEVSKCMTYCRKALA